MSIQQIIGLVVWWRRLAARVGLLVRQKQPRCEHIVTFVFWRHYWRGGFREWKQLRCRLDDPLLGDPVSLRACRLCEHNMAAAGTVKRVPVVTHGPRVPAA